MHPSAQREEGEGGRAFFCILEALGSGEEEEVKEEEAPRMSYSCTSRGSSQDPSSAQRPAANQPGGDGGGADGSQTQTAAMRVKKGCNSTDVGVPVTTEEDLLASTVITPEDVLGLQKITESKLTCRQFRVFWVGGRGCAPKRQRSSLLPPLPCPHVQPKGPVCKHTMMHH